MPSRSNTVIALHQCKPKAALERLNRVTGLEFSRWPESLLGYCAEAHSVLQQEPSAQLRQA